MTAATQSTHRTTHLVPCQLVAASNEQIKESSDTIQQSINRSYPIGALLRTHTFNAMTSWFHESRYVSKV